MSNYEELKTKLKIAGFSILTKKDKKDIIKALDKAQKYDDLMTGEKPTIAKDEETCFHYWKCKCGKSVLNGDEFCRHCGKKQDWSKRDV